MKRLVSILAVLILAIMPPKVSAAEIPAVIYDGDSGATAQTVAEYMPTAAGAALQVEAKSAVLMDMTSGQVLFEQNSREPLPIATVTKVMTLLLVMEAIDSGALALDDVITCSARAASMGGSQIWLEENEQMRAEDLLKAAVIVSANDACAALAEHLCGTVEAFVAKMNARATALGATDTHFVDCSGLDDTGVSSAHDIALISRELMMKHPTIQNYTTVWMDSLRGGESELVNTNRLVRFYNGATGLKTGTTAAAGCCLAATAERDKMPLCAVVLGAPSSDARFTAARNLLDYGFAAYTLYVPPKEQLAFAPVPVLHGVAPTVGVAVPQTVGVPLLREKAAAATVSITLAENVQAPVEAGQVLGEAVITVGEEEAARIPLVAADEVAVMTFSRALRRFFAAMTVGTMC